MIPRIPSLGYPSFVTAQRDLGYPPPPAPKFGKETRMNPPRLLGFGRPAFGGGRLGGNPPRYVESRNPPPRNVHRGKCVSRRRLKKSVPTKAIKQTFRCYVDRKTPPATKSIEKTSYSHVERRTPPPARRHRPRFPNAKLRGVSSTESLPNREELAADEPGGWFGLSPTLMPSRSYFTPSEAAAEVILMLGECSAILRPIGSRSRCEKTQDSEYLSLPRTQMILGGCFEKASDPSSQPIRAKISRRLKLRHRHNRRRREMVCPVFEAFRD